MLTQGTGIGMAPPQQQQMYGQPQQAYSGMPPQQYGYSM